MATAYISIKQIMDNILAHPLLRDLSLERAVNYSVEFLELVGCPKVYEEKLETLEIKDYKALLPCDFLEIIQVRCKNGLCLKSTTDSFNTSHKYPTQAPTYKIQGNIIYTSFKEGIIEISYQAFKLDADGFPLIPDNVAFKKGLEAYIKMNHFSILFDLGKIQGAVLQNAQQEYSWYVGKAQTSLAQMSLDETESFARMWNTLLLNNHHHSTGFAKLNSGEHIKTH